VTESGRFEAATKEFSAGTWLTAREAAIARDRVVLFLGDVPRLMVRRLDHLSNVAYLAPSNLRWSPLSLRGASLE